MEFKPGSEVATRYRVERVLGEDDGVTLLAGHDAHSGLFVAIKVFPPSVPEARLIDRFRRAQHVDSPYVPKLIELGGLGDGRTFVAMEFISGAPLAGKVGREGLPLVDAVSAVMQAAQAVAAAHRVGVTHRRLQTSKLLEVRSRSGGAEVRVLGFGTSIQVADLKSGELPTGVDYLAPEQISGATKGDQRADAWALGVILYELLTGHRPFTGLTRKAIAKAILTETPKPPRSLRPEIPWQLEQAVLRCLEKTPTSRIDSADALVEALAPFGAAPSSVAASGKVRHSVPPAQSIRPTVPPLLAPSGENRVAALGHILRSVPPDAPVTPTPTFHRFGPGGRIEGVKADDVVGIARGRRVADDVVPPPVRQSRAPAPRAGSTTSTTKIITYLIVGAVVLGLGMGALVRALWP